MIPIIARATVEATSLQSENLDPRFRKATAGMTMATLATGEVLEKLSDIPREQISFVLGTHFGEIESTLEFFMGINDANIARPNLFQNSLHNSTLGFTTIHWGLTGPALTVSTDAKTLEASLTLSETLLAQTPVVILCMVDCIPHELTDYYLTQFPFLRNFQNRAHCFAFATPDAQKKWNLRPMADQTLIRAQI